MAGSFTPILPQKALKTSRFPVFFKSFWNKIPLPKCGTYFLAITYGNLTTLLNNLRLIAK